MADDNTGVIARLFEQEVPEIGEGSIQIKAIARKTGVRCKVAVQSKDEGIDCVGACVGIRGCRIKKIVWELGGVGRIDIVRWNDSPELLITYALQPATIDKIILHSAEYRAVVVVKADQAVLALGRRGLNRELASQLSGWQIEIEKI